jgi:hypothetical protein
MRVMVWAPVSDFDAGTPLTLAELRHDRGVID